MTKKIVFLAFLILALGALFTVAQGQQTGQDKLDQARSGQAKAGGRPGKFRFYTNDELTADANRRTQIRATLAKLQKDVNSLAKNDQAKARLSSEIATFGTFVDTTEAREAGHAGPTAMRVEAILNDKKGVSQCTACHDEDDSHQHPTHGSREGSRGEGRR